MITLGRPEFLPAVFAGYLFLFVLAIWVGKRVAEKVGVYGRRDVLKKLGRPTGSFRLWFRLWVFSLIPFGFALILLQPVQKRIFQDPVYEEVEIVVLQDGSKSTLIKDIEPGKSRLDFMRDDLIAVVRSLRKNKVKDRVGYVLFAESAVPLVPIPTNDYERSLLQVLEAVDCHFIAHGLSQGTDIGGAILTGVSLFTKESKIKLLILLGDGENQGEPGQLEKNYQEGIDAYQKEKKGLERKGIQLGGGYILKTLVMGVGDPARASKVPDELFEDCRPRSFLKHIEGPQNGQEVESSPNHDFLKKVRDALQGEFKAAKRSGEIEAKIKDVLSETRPIKGYEPREEITDISEWFFAAIGFLLLIALFL